DPLVTGVQTCALPISFATHPLASARAHRLARVEHRAKRVGERLAFVRDTAAGTAHLASGDRIRVRHKHGRADLPRLEQHYAEAQIGRASCRERGVSGM